LKTTLINQLVIAAYVLGIAPEVIARWYGRSKDVSERRNLLLGTKNTRIKF
jgi:hypothetical protein